MAPVFQSREQEKYHEDEDPIDLVMAEEVQKTVRQLKNGKSPCPGIIPT